MSAGPALLVVALVALSALLLQPVSPGLGAAGTSAERTAAPRRRERALLLRLRPLLVVIGASGAWAMLGGGLLGALAGVLAGGAVWVVLGRAEDPADVRRREQLVRDLPTGVDLLGACLDAGSATESALVTVSRALPGPVGEELLAIHHRLDVGVDPVQVWRSVAEHPQLAALGRALARAHETGAPVGRAVHQLADELRARSRSDVESRARSIEVKAAAPLGLCLLPAFVLLGIVPMVAGVFSSMRLLP